MERRASSGPVSRPRMRAMTAERLAGVKTSAMGEEVGCIQYRTRNAECRREDGFTAKARRPPRDAKEEGFSELKS